MGAFFAVAAHSADTGPWSIEPTVGVATDYDSNPLLRQFGAESEDHIAATLDAPLRYDVDEFDFLFRPNGRLSNSEGYSSLASNYAHLDTAAQFTGETQSASLQAGLAQDSSLYYVGGLTNGEGVRRDTATASGDWTDLLTERSQIQVDSSWTRTEYGQATGGLGTLIDYRYTSAGPTYSFSLTERDTLKLLGSYGVYQSLDGLTESKTENLQLGYVRQLSEIWTLAVSAGYSRSKNTQKELNEYLYYFYGVLEYDTVSSNQNGTVYSATLTRQGERFNFTAVVSQSLQPTGFAFLSRQNAFNVNAGYVHSEKLDYGLSVVWVKAVNPEITSAGQAEPQEASSRFLNTQFSVNWHWAPQWTLSLSARRITQQYGPPPVSAAATDLSVNVVRKFLRTQF